MFKCPFCAESVGAEARICKHCQRPILFAVTVTKPIDEKQRYELMRLWQKESFGNIKHLTFSDYAESKKLLEKTPLTLAWDLNRFQASVLTKKVEHLSVEVVLQGGLPSTHEIASPQKESDVGRTILSFAYSGIAATAIGAGIFIWMHQQDAKQKLENGQAELRATQDLGFQIQPPMQMPSSPYQAPQAAIIQQNEAPANTGSHEIGRTEMEQVLNATVFISGESSLGSGFIITRDGYILTNRHVSSGMEHPQVTLRDGRRFEARKIKEDDQYDIALIKIDSVGLPIMQLGDSNEMFSGQPVYTVGNPGGLAFTVTKGILSFNGRYLEGIPYLQTDAAINRGNSGGPLLNDQLQVVGINTLTSLNEQGISFSLPINLACSSEGVAARLSTNPPSCNPFNPSQEAVQSAEITPGRGNGDSSSSHYQAEIDSLKGALDRETADLQDRYNKLSARSEELKQEVARDSINLSVKERAREENKELAEKGEELKRAQAEAQVTFLNGVIGVLERQALDPKFSRSRSKIDEQIQSLKASKEQIVASLGR